MTTRLNVRGDGMHAYSDLTDVQQWRATQWLIECVKDNIKHNDSNWSEWNGPDHIISAFGPACNTVTGDLTMNDPDLNEGPLYRIAIGQRGRSVLAACITGEDHSDLMSEWSGEVCDAGSGATP